MASNAANDGLVHADQQQRPFLEHACGGNHAGRVLLVDDEALIRWSLTQMLEERGFSITAAASASDALASARSDAFDVVLLDLRLPDSHDLSLLSRIRQLVPGAAVILMTAYSSEEVAQQARDLGAARVVSKPFEMADMVRLVLDVLH
jgi:DNA-binding NtrC family response regulator